MSRKGRDLGSLYDTPEQFVYTHGSNMAADAKLPLKLHSFAKLFTAKEFSVFCVESFSGKFRFCPENVTYIKLVL